RASGLIASRFQRVGAKVERRAGGQRRTLLGALVAEHAGEMRIEPFRIIASHVRRRAGKIGGSKPRAFGLGQRRRGMAGAVGQPRAWAHYGNPSMIRTMKISHMIASTTAPMPKNVPRNLRLLLVVWI